MRPIRVISAPSSLIVGNFPPDPVVYLKIQSPSKSVPGSTVIEGGNFSPGFKIRSEFSSNVMYYFNTKGYINTRTKIVQLIKTKPKKSRTKKTDYTTEIFNAVREKDGITKDSVYRKIGGYRNAVMKDIKKMCDLKILEYKKDGLHIINENLPTITKNRKNLREYLKNYREVLKNTLPRIKENARKSGKPIFYTEPIMDPSHIDARTGKPMEGKLQRINERCKDDLLMIMHSVNIVIRASYGLYTSQISSLEESGIQVSVKEIEKDQKGALNEIRETKRTLLKMTAQKGNVDGIAVFHMWWFQLTAGLQMQEDSPVWIEE